MPSIHCYEDRLTNYIQQKDLAGFRKQHFQQWSLAENGCAYCVSSGTWPFFGFVPRPDQDMLLVAVNQKKEFLYYRLNSATLQNQVEGQKRLWDIPHQQLWQATLLDFCQVHPLFLEQLAWKHMPGSLEMWDESRAIILVAQLARPLGPLGADPQMELTQALFQFMEKPIIKFLVNEFPIATLGQYQFLWEAEDPAERQERMQALKRRPGLVPRFLLADS
ncbi:hypothetical protein B1757_06865 [Acidithiobacillus marinus]|uniref:Uncharacterized protein n=1 Tax=Acidithiobacillus marinus TaxID=187490 RepID=A0A2I1DMC9_9PROT|nr:hypothetical protein [Acidithiobacillus marinus]PKY11026.1 hypothetical protein B1757_06865 [Acidithiobacillus marinus]